MEQEEEPIKINSTPISNEGSLFRFTTLSNPYQQNQTIVPQLNQKYIPSSFDPIDIETGRVIKMQESQTDINNNNFNIKDNNIKQKKQKDIQELREEKDKEHQKTYQEYLETGKLPNTEDFADFKDYLFTLQVYAGAVKNYDKAERIGNDILKLNEAMKIKIENEKKQKERDITTLYKENTEFEHKNFNLLWDQKFQEVKDDFQRRFTELKEKHKKELEDFEYKWNDPSYLRSYSKVSTRILDLRAREESQCKNKMWKEAKETSRRMQSLIRSESKMKQKQASQDMAKELEKLKARQKKEEDNLNQKYKHQMIVLQASKDNEEKPFFIRKTILSRRALTEKENCQPNIPRLNKKRPLFDEKPVVLSVKPIGVKSSLRKSSSKPTKLLF